MHVSVWMLCGACILSVVAAEEPLFNISTSCGELYEKGVEAYLESRFSDCVQYIEEALERYHNYKKQLQRCRVRCAKESPDYLYPVNVENLHFFETAVRSTFCILQCKSKHKNTFGLYNLDSKVESKFLDHKPYEYLHLCYFQVNQRQKAASAAYTYLVGHPDDSAMQKSLKYYQSLPEVKMHELINNEAKEYVYYYLHGVNSYDHQEWKAVIDYMEDSLDNYLQSEEDCRADCEGPFNQGWFPDFIPSIANHFTYVLRCKRKCKDKLSSLNGDVRDNLLPNHYHYLQYAYYKVGDIPKCLQAAVSYLLFEPNDETMLKNLEFYGELEASKNVELKPRNEAVKYSQRENYEVKLLDFIDSFSLDSESVINKESDIPNTETVTQYVDRINEDKRFVEDNVISKEECKGVLDIAKMFAIAGDGYNNGSASPHTKLEKFEGFSISRGAVLVYFGMMDAKILQFYLNITEIVRRRIQQHFSLKTLYYSFTHLVCRSALADAPTVRDDLSHAIHSDNCNIKLNGQCTRAPPAFTWRDYSAILYLNDDFEGGEFIFVSDPMGKQIENAITPTCGRMVGFSSGSENLHGVNAVKKGSRCAIGLWFTTNVKYREVHRDITIEMLEKISKQ